MDFEILNTSLKKIDTYLEKFENHSFTFSLLLYFLSLYNLILSFIK